MKKKILSLVLAACMLCGFSTTAFAETTIGPMSRFSTS